MSEKQCTSKKILFGAIGILLGFPLSYFFQAPLIRKIPMSEYLKAIPKILSSGVPVDANQKAMQDALIGNAVLPIVLSCFVCAFLLGVIGHFIDKSNKE